MRKSSVRKTKEQLIKDFEEKLNLGYNFVDYFLTIGVQPEIFLSPWLYESPLEELNSTYKEQLKPKILNKFPSFDKKNLGIDEAIINHCFPLGFKVQEFPQEKPDPKIFSIILDNNNYSSIHQNKYAVCLLFYESINDYLKLYEKYFNISGNNSNLNNIKKSLDNRNLRSSFLSEQNGLFNFNDNLSTYSTNTYNNNYLITKKLNNFSLLSVNRASELSQKETNISTFNNKYFKKYYIPKIICLISLYPFLLELKKIITIIYKYSNLGKQEIPLEKIINNLVLEVPIPPRGLYSIEYPINNQTILLKNSRLNELSYVNFEFNLLFQTFSVEQILQIFQHLMLGVKIIFFSTEIELLTPIILTCLTLLFPFKFPFTVVSVLPKDSYNLIDNITPEIFGVNEKYYYSFFTDNDIEINDHLLIVDIDMKKIITQPNAKEGLPPLPKYLKDNLTRNLYKYFHSIHEKNSKDIKEPFASFQFIIRNYFLQFQIELLKDYPKFLNSKIYQHPLEKPFKVKKFLKSVSKDDHLFYEKFIETQLFNDYILKRMTPKDKDEQTEVLYFEEKIFLLNNENDKIVFLNSNLFNIKNEYKVPKINSNIDEEILHFYIHEQNSKELLIDGIAVDIQSNNNQKKPLFNYIIFPKLNNDLFFKTEIKNYFLDLSIFNEIKNINSELISKSHLSRVELQTNEMTNFVYILWLKVWANSFYYHDNKEQKYRYMQMLKVFNKINQHEMNVISNLFQGLIKSNVDEDLIFNLYNKILQLKLSPTFDIYNAIKNKIRKKTKNSTMPSSEITKYLLNRGQIQINFNKGDLNKKSFRKRTMKSIYDKYMIKEKVTFNMEEICNNCDHKIDIYNFQKNINNTNDDIVWAKCPFCGFGYLPKLKVIFGDEINKNDKLSKCTSIVDEVILYSPKTLKMNFFDNSNIDIDNFKLNYNPIFWNLIWYFKINGLPFDFFLPYEENIFFKGKRKALNFFKVNISSNYFYNEKIEQILDRRTKSYLESNNNSCSEIKLNNFINNKIPSKNQSPISVTNNPKTEAKTIKAKFSINQLNNNLNVQKNLNNLNSNIQNNTFYNLSLKKIDKKQNIPKTVFIDNNIAQNKTNNDFIHIKNNSYNKDYINNSISFNNQLTNYLGNNPFSINNNRTIYNNYSKNLNALQNNSMYINNNLNIKPINLFNNNKINNTILNNSMIINNNKNIANNSININKNIDENKLIINKINYINNSNIANNNRFNNTNILNYTTNNNIININKINLKKHRNLNSLTLVNNNFYKVNPYAINNSLNQNLIFYNQINNSYDLGINKSLNNNKIDLQNSRPYINPYIYK